MACIPKVMKRDGKQTSYLIFCYGDHSKQMVSEINLVSYENNVAEAFNETTKNAKNTFDKLERFPNIYRST